MYRSVISFLLLTLLVGSVIAINPQAREETTDLWEETKPTFVAWKDRILEVFRELIYGGFDAQIEHDPVSPKWDIEIINARNDGGYLI